jgi:AraC-like DNA-binding protein
VTRLLHADPSLPATLVELGKRTHSSERTLSRLFASELSMSFLQWRTLLRVQRALLDLSDGASVTDTALQLGWSNPSSFIDSFRDLVGQTPGRYRAAALSASTRHQGS